MVSVPVSLDTLLSGVWNLNIVFILKLLRVVEIIDSDKNYPTIGNT